jgi:HEPN domain-containing protein
MNEHDIVAEWLQIAFDDYDSALYLFNKPHRKPHEIICYHCQQSAEKALKAFLCASGVDVPKTHETGILCRQCADINHLFSKFLKPCEELAIYATETRYPIRIEIDEATVKRNLEQAFEIYNFVIGIIDSSISNLEIRKLAPDLAEDYVRFFDETPHDVDVDERKCRLPWLC